MTKGIFISGVDSNFSSVSGVFYSEEEYDQLFQQLADVSNERDAANKLSDHYASCFREAANRLNASEARNAEAGKLLDRAEKLLRWNKDYAPSIEECCSVGFGIQAFLAQSAPATDEQGAGS